MADKTVKGVTGRGPFARDQSLIQQKDSVKSSEEEKLLKERLLDEKMKLIRQQNEERLRRQKEIEEDIKNASLHSHQVGEEKPAQAEHNMAGVPKDNSAVPKMRGRARGRILAKMAKEELQAHRFENKRKQNYALVEKELQEEKTQASPPPGGSSSFLSDDRRVDMSKVASRSSYSWGGSQFEDVVEKVNKEHSKPRREHQDIELSMTGKERKEYLKWKVERNRIDKERKLRQKSGETWQREWDKCKVQREANSLHERQEDQHNRRRSGQRFGERSRRRPDWDLHDDRGEDTEQDFNHVNDNRAEIEKDVCGTEPSDDWEESNDPKQNIVRKDQSEDWQDSSTTNIVRKADPDLKEETHVALDNTTLNSENQKGHTSYTTDKADSEKPQETFSLKFDEAGKCNEVENLTVVVDSEGKRNIRDVSSEMTNNNTNKYPGELKETISDKDELDEGSVKSDKIIEQPKPHGVQKKHRQKEEQQNQSVNHQEQNDGSKEMVEKDETNKLLKSDIESNKTDDKTNSERTQEISISDHPTSKDNLPKLDIKKIDENKETVPDFLKTPIKKNWADCEYDEEVDLPPLEWDSLTKCLKLE